MINRFSQFLVEEEKVVYFTFGRLNPPTIGHGKLLDKLASFAGRNPYRVFLSQSANNKKDPIPFMNKIKHVRKMFPKHARQVLMNKKVVTPFHALSALYDEGFRKVVMVAGSDRVDEYKQRLNMYNGKEGRHGFYNFEGGIKVISAGARDPDAEGAEGASGTKQREYATANDFIGFSKGLPKAMSNADAKRLFNDVRKGLGLKEAKEFKNHVQLEPVSNIREEFVKGNLYELGESVIIKKTDEVGTISVIGTNYVIVETTERKTRQWLDAIEKLDEAARIRWKRGKYPGEIEATIGGKKYKIEKALDHNDRHKGEWKVMVWDRGDWEWETTEYGKANAKAWIMDKHGLSESTKPHREVVKAYKKSLDAEHRDAEYGTTATKRAVTRTANTLSKKINQYHPGLDMNDKIKLRTQLQNMKEENQPEWGTPESTAKAKAMTPGEKNEGNGLWANIRARRAAGKPKLKPGDKNYPKSLDIPESERSKESPQDSDIKDRPGTQPKAYHAGLSKAQKISRDRQFKKQSKMSDDDPKAYKPAAGDKTTKTKPSKHTLRYKQMFGEEKPSHSDMIKARIDREKSMDKKKHDRMMDRARMTDTIKKNKATK